MEKLEKEYEHYRVLLTSANRQLQKVARESIDHRDAGSWQDRYDDLLGKTNVYKGAMLALTEQILDQLES